MDMKMQNAKFSQKKQIDLFDFEFGESFDERSKNAKVKNVSEVFLGIHVHCNVSKL